MSVFDGMTLAPGVSKRSSPDDDANSNNEKWNAVDHQTSSGDSQKAGQSSSTTLGETQASVPSTPTTLAAAAAAETDYSSKYRDRLVEFYKTHNPGKVDTVDATLAKYEGKEEALFQKLLIKYTGSKFPMPAGDGPTCFLEFSIGGTVAGRVFVKLYQDKTPVTCENFRNLCTGEKGLGRAGKALCYKYCKVHRVVPTFCVQLGDFTKGDGTGGESIYTWGTFKDEAFMQHSKKGLLSMANNGPDRNGSQFFFTLKRVHQLDGKHVVFGEVTKGMDIVERIGRLQTSEKQVPEETVMVTNCGEVKDGKEVECQSAADKAPGGKATTGGSSRPFSFGSSAPKPSLFGFGGGTSFSSSSTTTASSTPFGFGASSSKTSTTTTSSPFTSFGASSSTTTANSTSFGLEGASDTTPKKSTSNPFASFSPSTNP
jgi:cyclophilin family peptidyl-prolyl cis-trans isomerase